MRGPYNYSLHSPRLDCAPNKQENGDMPMCSVLWHNNSHIVLDGKLALVDLTFASPNVQPYALIEHTYLLLHPSSSIRTHSFIFEPYPSHPLKSPEIQDKWTQSKSQGKKGRTKNSPTRTYLRVWKQYRIPCRFFKKCQKLKR